MSNVHISSTSVLKDQVSGDKHVIKHDLPVENSYAAMTGIFPGITKSITDMVESESTIAYNSFYNNGDDLKNNYEIDNYVEIIDLNNNDELKTIIEKIRDFIDKNKKNLAAEFNENHPGIVLADLDTDVDDLPDTHKYEDLSDDDTVREKIMNVNKLSETVFKVLTNDNYVSKQTPPVTFDRTVVISIDELNVLIPKYYNSFVYIVGQAFNVFSPRDGVPPNISFYEKFDRLLKDVPKSLIFSFGNRDLMVKSFFELSNIKMLMGEFDKDSKQDGNEGYYVGGLNGSQKQGNGVMRWINKNVFEGTFANDAINEGNFVEFGATSKKLIMTNAANGEATLDGVVGIFDTVGGVFSLPAASPSSASSTTVGVPSSGASPTTIVGVTLSNASSPTIVGVPSSSASGVPSSGALPTTIVGVPSSSASGVPSSSASPTIVGVPNP